MFDEIFKKSLYLQDLLSRRYNIKTPSQLNTAGEVLDYIKDIKTFLDDEFAEVYTALGGHDDDPKAVWKTWKFKNSELRDRKLSDFTEEELSDLKGEMIDVFTFVVLQMLAVGITSNDVIEQFRVKNIENLSRLANDY